MPGKFDYKNAVYATGKRKSSVARVWIKKGTGEVTVRRGKTFLSPTDAFQSEIRLMRFMFPLRIVETVLPQLDVMCDMRGGGLSGQADAARHGIAKAIKILDDTCKPLLDEHKLLTRDARRVQPKNTGYTKARRRPQKAKR